MHLAQALFYLLGIALIFIAAFPIPVRVSLALLGAASALLAYALPAIVGAGG
jgi:hypothetical protein